ncbi:hypothetical protein HY990_03300 [Candidatus Micrarchaeota archaeon]|nr:hypothetical protein [Candidatus Micrarchaeota archaeon]
MILLFTKHNPASANIAKCLIEEHGFTPDPSHPLHWSRNGVLLIDTQAPSVLEVPTDFPADETLVVLSTHRSKIEEKIFTIHYPGNWSKADLGGSPKCLNVAPASLMKSLSIELERSGHSIGYKFSLEADHHGPTCNLPIIFVELGSTESEWNDKNAASLIAASIVRVLDAKPKTYKTFFGVGGGHYPKLFNKIQLDESEGLAVGHIAPKFVLDELDEDLFRQAIEKSVEKVELVIISKDEVNAKHREKMIGFAAKFGIEVRLV